jgi:aspartate racemase
VKTLGIVAFTGAESTIEYYRHTLAQFSTQDPHGACPPFLMNCIDVNRVVQLTSGGNLAELAQWLAQAVNQLAAGGAQVAILASNTPHVVFDDVQRLVSIPLVSIVEETAAAAARMQVKRLGLFGTRWTMQGQFYAGVLGRHGVERVLPREDELAYVHEKYTKELLANRFLPETRAGLVAIARRMKKDDGIEALALGGTELSLILEQRHIPELPLLDTMQIQVAAAVRAALARP